MPFNIPNSLTWARIALIPFSSASTTPADVISAEGKNLVATVTFIVAAVTDWFDGYRPAASGRPRPSAPSSTRWPTS
jgi:CDP-diacylglycerol--glycerol-3-phosphate 3-phosphatidyltransferase